MEPLGVVDPVLAEQFECLCILDAFRDGLLPKPLGKADHRLDEVLIGRVGGQVTDELDIDLEDRDREAFEVGEAAKAGPEVIQRDRAAQLAQSCAKRSPTSMSPISAVSVSSNTRFPG